MAYCFLATEGLLCPKWQLINENILSPGAVEPCLSLSTPASLDCDLVWAFDTSIPTPNDTLSPTRPATPPNPFKEFHSMVTNHSNILAYGANLIQTVHH